MDHKFKDLTVIRPGASNGDGTVISIDLINGTQIYAVSVAREGFSYTGPTWAYLFENEGLTLIDAGELGSFSKLDDGLECAGFRAKDIQRVIITHGHEDHDGAVAELVSETGAEVWAHDIYAHLQVYDPRLIMRTAASPLQQEMRRVADNNGSFPSESPERDNYIATRKALKIDHPIQHNEMIGNLTLLFTPGHSPDELCMSLDGVVFTGDHVLPEISPHPTMKTNFSPEIRNNLPGQYQDASKWYGLETYLKSLKVVSDLGEGVQVLPAHRYFNRDHFNFINTGRARDIIQHHGERLAHIVEKLNGGEMGLEDLTRGIFEHRKLESDNLLAGLSEIVAHVEVLEDLGDVEVIDGVRIIGTGQSNHREFIDGLVS